MALVAVILIYVRLTPLALYYNGSQLVLGGGQGAIQVAAQILNHLRVYRRVTGLATAVAAAVADGNAQ